MCSRSRHKVNTIQIVPVAPTAMHKRVGLSENEGMRSFLSRVNIWVYYLSGSNLLISEQSWTSILLALYGAALLAASREFDHPSSSNVANLLTGR